MYKNLRKARLVKKIKCQSNRTRTLTARNYTRYNDESVHNEQMQKVRSKINIHINNKTDTINKRVATFRCTQIKRLKQRVKTLENTLKNGYKISNCWDIISQNIRKNTDEYSCTKSQMYDLVYFFVFIACLIFMSLSLTEGN